MSKGNWNSLNLLILVLQDKCLPLLLICWSFGDWSVILWPKVKPDPVRTKNKLFTWLKTPQVSGLMQKWQCQKCIQTHSQTWCKMRSSSGNSSSQNSQGNMVSTKQKFLWETNSRAMRKVLVYTDLTCLVIVPDCACDRSSTEVGVIVVGKRKGRVCWCVRLPYVVVPDVAPHVAFHTCPWSSIPLQAESQHVVQAGGILVWWTLTVWFGIVAASMQEITVTYN